MGHIYLSHSHPITIYACPIPYDVSHGMPIGIPFPWTSLNKTAYMILTATCSQNCNFEISMNGVRIQQTYSIKYLGAIVDN